jgi:DNA-binding XRE family transcriptional regulator|tara:strand:+ start:2270 stop:2926 length:657 start_codon:yes stop_codon:yes gene_type:complete
MDQIIPINNEEYKLYSGDFNQNLRFIEVMELLETNPRIVSNKIGCSVSGVNVFTSPQRPKKITTDFIKKLESVMPFLNTDFIVYGEDHKPFIKKPTKEEAESFKVKYGVKSPTKKGINQERCSRVYEVRMMMSETQLSFAEKLGVERHLISAIEGCRQNPSIDLLILMRRIMNINLWWVMTGEEEMKLDFQASDVGKIRELEHENKVLKRVIEKLSLD